MWCTSSPDRKDNMTPDEILERARSAIGAPVRHAGYDPVTGLDCAGLIAWVYGLTRPERRYGRGDLLPLIDSLMAESFDLIPASALAPADAMLFRAPAMPNHLAIYAGKNEMIHANEKYGRVMRSGIPASWLDRRLHRVWRSKSSAE